MSNLDWGVPTQRKRKTEKFDTPVVTMAKLEKAGAGRKFSFNKAAQEAFGIDSETEQTVMIGFEKGENKNGIFVKVVNGENDLGYKLTKSATFSNKKVFEFISDLRDLSNDVENELHLAESEDVEEAFEVSQITTSADEREAIAEESKETATSNVEIEDEKKAEMTENGMSNAETQEKMKEEQSEKVAEEVEDSTSEQEEETW